jgi:hypothetical protein
MANIACRLALADTNIDAGCEHEITKPARR